MSLRYSQPTLPDRRRLYRQSERKLPIGKIARQFGRLQWLHRHDRRRRHQQGASAPIKEASDTIRNRASRSIRRRQLLRYSALTKRSQRH